MSFNSASSLNRENRMSVNSEISVGSAKSEFSAHDVKDSVGYLNGTTVAKGTANPKPWSFMGWLKRLFSFGASSNESTTANPKITETKNFGRIAQKFADIADEAVQQAPGDVEVAQYAHQSREAANKATGALESGNPKLAEQFLEEAKNWADHAAEAVEVNSKTLLDKFAKAPSSVDEDDEITEKEAAELAVNRNINQNEELLRYLNTLDSDKRSKTISQMITFKEHDNQGESISLENQQQKKALGEVLRDASIVYNHQSKMFEKKN